MVRVIGVSGGSDEQDEEFLTILTAFTATTSLAIDFSIFVMYSSIVPILAACHHNSALAWFAEREGNSLCL